MYRKLSFFLIVFMFFVSFPGVVFSCGDFPDLDVCGPVAISRNIEYVFFPEPESKYVHLFGNQLSPLSFYLLYSNLLEVDLSEEDFAKIGNYIETGYYEKPSNDYYDGHLSVNRSQDSFRLMQETLEDRKNTYSKEEFNHLKENYNNIPYAGALYPIEEEGYIVDCSDIETVLGEIYSSEKEKENKEEGFFNKIINAIKEFFQRIFSIFFKGENIEKPEAEDILIGDVYRIFNHEGSEEYLRDQEYQNAIYYFYRASFINDCDYENSKKLFRGIMEDEESPWYAYAHLGYIRVLARQAALYNNKHTFEERNDQRHRFWFRWENNFNTQPEVEERYQKALRTVNEYIKREDLSRVRDDLLFQKRRMLLYFFKEEEFLKAGENIDRKDPVDLLYNLSIFDGQAKLLTSLKGKGEIKEFDIEEHAEITQYFYYWNFTDNSTKTINRIKRHRERFKQKDLWLVLLLRKASLSEEYEIEKEYIDIALSKEKDNQLYYPLNYYASKIIYDKNSAIAEENILKILEDENISTIPYNYFSELIIEESENVERAIGYIYKRVDSGILHNRRRPEYKENGSESKEKEFLISDGQFYYAIKEEIPIDMLYNNPMFREHRKRTILFNAIRLDRPDIFNPIVSDIAKKENEKLMHEATLHTHDNARAKFMILYAILHSDSCYLYSEKTCFSGDSDSNPPPLFEDRLTDHQKEQKKQENLILNDSVIKSFAEIIFDYHAVNPGDERIPESLHMLTFYNRYCTRDRSVWPRKVFRFLHSNYPNSKWTEKTPYYY